MCCEKKNNNSISLNSVGGAGAARLVGPGGSGQSGDQVQGRNLYILKGKK